LIALSDGNLVVEVHEAGAYVAVVYDITGVEWITKGDPSRPTKAGMAFLAPYANRVRGASYEFEGVRYELPKNSEGHAIHGLLLTEPFEVEDMDERRVVLRTTLRHRLQQRKRPLHAPQRQGFRLTGLSSRVRVFTLAENKSRAMRKTYPS